MMLRVLLVCCMAALAAGCLSAPVPAAPTEPETAFVPGAVQYVYGSTGIMALGQTYLEGTARTSCAHAGAVASEVTISGRESGSRIDLHGARNVTLAFEWVPASPSTTNLTFQVMPPGPAKPGLNPQLPWLTSSSPAVWRLNETALSLFSEQFTVYAILPRDCPTAGVRDLEVGGQVVQVQAVLRDLGEPTGHPADHSHTADGADADTTHGE
jgi:hypothetical protein